MLHLSFVMFLVTVRSLVCCVFDAISVEYAVVAVKFSTFKFFIFGNVSLKYWLNTSWSVAKLLIVMLSASMYCAETLLMSIESKDILVFRQLTIAGLVSVSTLALFAVMLYTLLYEV